MTILPAVPAGDLAPAGHAVPAEAIRSLIEATSKTNPGAVLDMQLSVAVDVLEAIAAGAVDPTGLAEQGLVAIGADNPEAVTS